MLPGFPSKGYLIKVLTNNGGLLSRLWGGRRCLEILNLKGFPAGGRGDDTTPPLRSSLETTSLLPGAL